MSHSKWAFRLQDMLDAARKIQLYVEALSFGDFMGDEKTCDAVIRQLTVIGEAAIHVPHEISSGLAVRGRGSLDRRLQRAIRRSLALKPR